MGHKKQKVAVIGGGVGAITATYALTQLPDWQDRYDITLYQLGWRLGGKGASGRNMEQGGRIEEHGLHIWAGFYDNGFRLMRDCYEQLNETGLRHPDAPLGTLEKAFTGLNHFFLTEEVEGKSGQKEIHPWRIDFYKNSQKPGSGKVVPSPFSFFQELLEFIASELGKLLSDANMLDGYEAPSRFHSALSRAKVSAAAPSPFHHLLSYSKTMSEKASTHTQADLLILSDMARHSQNWLHDQDLDGRIKSDAARRLQIIISLSSAFFRGAISDGLFRRGFDAIDNWEISQWLLHYGASKEAVYSAVFRGCYDYVFGYPGGVMDDRSVGAGTAIRGLLRLAFCYKGALFYKMMAGMGDTIFGPYYQVLKERGVKFKYFNAATNLRLNAQGTAIDAIDMVEQATLKAQDYDPLVTVRDLPCWPSAPLWDQLVDGEKLRKSGIDYECEKSAPKGRAYQLKAGEDFDQVVLGASLGSLPYMTKELATASTRWQAMLDNVKTVATHAAQFWMNTDAEAMGWNALVARHNSGKQENLRSVATGFSEPLDTWADMSDLIEREAWGADAPKSIAYFCSPAGDAGDEKTSMTKRTQDWANTELVRIWPGAKKQGKFNRALLHAPGAKTEQDKFDAQYFRENFYGSERYVMSVPNSVQYRLTPDGSGFSNLFLAGDWTRCGMNAGCVEAATISGLACARGLSGDDILIVGEGDLAPDAGPLDGVKLESPYAQTAPWPLTPMFATGKIDGFFSFHAVDSAALEKVLPKGMRLHPQSLTPEGTHPVAILANQQLSVRASILPKLFAFRNYLEAIVAINFVEIDGHEGVFSYLPNLYLNSRLPQQSGVWWYGYNKRMGQLSMGHDFYQVADPTGKPIWNGHYTQPDFARPLTDFAAAGRVQSLCEQVVVTKNKFGKWQFSSFDFNLTSSYVAGVHAQVDILDEKLADLPSGIMKAPPISLDVGGSNHDNQLPGAFRIWTSWTLSNPFDSSRLARLVKDQTKLP